MKDFYKKTNLPSTNKRLTTTITRAPFTTLNPLFTSTAPSATSSPPILLLLPSSQQPPPFPLPFPLTPLHLRHHLPPTPQTSSASISPPQFTFPNTHNYNTFSFSPPSSTTHPAATSPSVHPPPPFFSFTAATCTSASLPHPNFVLSLPSPTMLQSSHSHTTTATPLLSSLFLHHSPVTTLSTTCRTHSSAQFLCLFPPELPPTSIFLLSPPVSSAPPPQHTLCCSPPCFFICYTSLNLTTLISINVAVTPQPSLHRSPCSTLLALPPHTRTPLFTT